MGILSQKVLSFRDIGLQFHAWIVASKAEPIAFQNTFSGPVTIGISHYGHIKLYHVMRMFLVILGHIDNVVRGLILVEKRAEVDFPVPCKRYRMWKQGRGCSMGDTYFCWPKEDFWHHQPSTAHHKTTCSLFCILERPCQCWMAHHRVHWLCLPKLHRRCKSL